AQLSGRLSGSASGWAATGAFAGDPVRPGSFMACRETRGGGVGRAGAGATSSPVTGTWSEARLGSPPAERDGGGTAGGRGSGRSPEGGGVAAGLGRPPKPEPGCEPGGLAGNPAIRWAEPPLRLPGPLRPEGGRPPAGRTVAARSPTNGSSASTTSSQALYRLSGVLAISFWTIAANSSGTFGDSSRTGTGSRVWWDIIFSTALPSGNGTRPVRQK